MAAARAEAAQAQEAAQRLTAELQRRTSERDAARGRAARRASERDRLADELLAAAAQADDAARSRTALEEIHEALAAARARMSGIR